MLFPNIALFTETEHHYLVELLGASHGFFEFRVKKHEQASTEQYISQFDVDTEESEPALKLDGRRHQMRKMCVSHDLDIKALKKRFRHIDLFPSKLFRQNSKGNLLAFGDKFESCSMDNCLLVNNQNNLYRCKHILHLDIVDKGISKSEYRRFLDEVTNQNADAESRRVSSVHTVSARERKTIVSGQLQSLYLFPGLRETTIGDFINEHREIVREAFDAESVEYEKRLEWVDKNTKLDREYIRPDILLERSDGYYDIIDLKTAFLQKRSITTGESRNRKFLSRVEKGASQLAQYEYYFESAKNRDFAKEEHGIEIDSPRKILIVGSYDNASKSEVREAMRRYNRIEIIDYDTLVTLFLKSGSSESE